MDTKLNEMIGLAEKTEKLTKEEAKQVFSYYKETKNKQLLDALVLANEKLVKHTLKKYWDSPDIDDIMQEGRLGLIYAIERFDPDMGNNFSTYACPYIQGFASRYIDANNPLYTPVHVQGELRKYKKNKGRMF